MTGALETSLKVMRWLWGAGQLFVKDVVSRNGNFMTSFTNNYCHPVRSTTIDISQLDCEFTYLDTGTMWVVFGFAPLPYFDDSAIHRQSMEWCL